MRTIKQPIPENYIMFCLDVKSVCPSVPRKEDREACTIALENRSNISIPTEDILKMLDLVLENNNFCFNGSHNLLTEGTAIASHLGMNYACTFLGQWEEHVFQQFKLHPSSYWRYVDDIWGHGLEELKEFQKMIEFLDGNVILENGRIKTDLYTQKQISINIYMQLHVIQIQ